MNLRVITLLLTCLPVLLNGAPGSYSFGTRILPLLTKAGCNTGECHGAAIGAGGFRLSLLGYDPATDYRHITRERNARRIDLVRPEDSLLLRKPTKQTPHEGGRVFKADSSTYRELRDWLAAGAPEGDPRLTTVSILPDPTEIRLPEIGQTATISVNAVLSDGSRRDVTHLTLFDSDDDGLAVVDDHGRVEVLARGTTSIMIRHGGQVAAVRVGVPFQAASIPPDLPVRNFIDRHVAEHLARWHLVASPVCEPEVFFRRAHLDLIGRLPEPAAIESFLAATDTPQHRDKVIHELLHRDAFTDFWTLKLGDLLLINPKKQGPDGSRAYHNWLRQQIAANRPIDELVTALLTASGEIAGNGPANFYKLASDPRDMGEYVSRAFLGMRVACARCHNHPFDRWSTRDYHEFAAFFAHTVVENNRVIVKDRGEVRHPKDQSIARPRPLGGRLLEFEGTADRRTALADWLTAPDNPWFARAFVNRVWKELLGRGIIDPVDDVRITNPPANPALLDALTADFIRHGFDLRQLVGTIARSATYQLSSQANETNRADQRFFSHALRKPLRGQVLADAVTSAIGTPEHFSDHPEVSWSTELPDVTAESRTLDVFGRCPRTDGCEAGNNFGGGLTQALHLINSDAINSRLHQGVVRELVRTMSDEDVIEVLYLRTLSRPPTRNESARWKSLFRNSHDRAAFYEDLIWALMNSREFTFNH